ncbi:hypothetical protein FB451DRAFT_1391267 [Mycena latifolia]|nr:hypothetical protein FB451DRAFT_1391267 [Mycena latifolia]
MRRIPSSPHHIAARLALTSPHASCQPSLSHRQSSTNNLELNSSMLHDYALSSRNWTRAGGDSSWTAFVDKSSCRGSPRPALPSCPRRGRHHAHVPPILHLLASEHALADSAPPTRRAATVHRLCLGYARAITPRRVEW